MKVEFYRHSLETEDKALLLETADSIFLTTGEVVYDFERKFSAALGNRRTIGLMSCTAALHLGLLALEIGAGDEVITTPMTFIATPNSVLHAGATPVFVDVEPTSGNLDPDRLEAAITPRTKAIMPVHLYGEMCDMRRLRAVADKHGLKIIEDAAHCIEAERDGVKPGNLGDVACYSFYATKNLTCGEGGAISANDDELAEKLRKLSLHGMSKSAADRYVGRYQHWDMEFLGWKYNMNNLQAALLVNQLKRLETYWQRREAICRRYEAGFAGVPGLDFPRVASNAKSARHLFTLWVEPALRDRFLHELQQREIGVAVNYRAVHLLSFYREQFGFERGSFPVAERIGDSTITLPLYPKMTDEQVDYVIEQVLAVQGMLAGTV
ncbi:MAG: DegT/DnrJ/EryC1/StrS family aminotransferase [Blastocatellia bacterium]|nr:DegT/DnrJ/EryC1/StrS family aminotransferase [Blastocatellia bacterium]